MNNNIINELIQEALIKLNESIDNTESFDKWRIQMYTLISTIGEFKLRSHSLSVTNRNSSFDPIDWPSARCVAHSLLDSSLNFIRSIRDRPVWQPLPIDVRIALENDSLPQHGQSLSDVCQYILSYILPYSLGNTHPRFWGWVVGEGTLGGVLADMVAATMNSNTCACTQSPVLVERTVIRWLHQIFGFPEVNAGGLLVSGTTMATVISLAAARQRILEHVRKDGLANGPQLVAYGSTEVHICVVKALELLGLGSNSLRRIAVDGNFSIKIDELKAQIKVDQDNGLIPFCIVGTAGTVNTGAFDNLLELSVIARSENIWFHVDGAFGSLVILDANRRHLVSGINHADSLAFDFHKWLHCPYDAGCVLVRDNSSLFATFCTDQSYYATSERACASDKPWFCHFGPEMSRPFRALRVWFTLKEQGMIKLGQKIAENCDQAQYLVSLLEKHDKLIRIVRPTSLNIVNFRFEPEQLAETNCDVLDDFNNELVADIQLSGVAVPTTTYIGERLYIRVAIVSHRCTLEDFDLFVETLLNLCQIRLEATLLKPNSGSVQFNDLV